MLFRSINVVDFYRGINKVTPSLIRTEADELTYHFHVMIRYEIEKQLISGTIKSKDIPLVWNDLYKKYLGINVPDDKNGCLQDVHWSHGSFGYFATYSIGSFYAAQIWNTIQLKHSDVCDQIKNGNSHEVFEWLNENILYNINDDSAMKILKIDTDIKTNLIHLLPNQVSSNINVCVFKQVYTNPEIGRAHV